MPLLSMGGPRFCAATPRRKMCTGPAVLVSGSEKPRLSRAHMVRSNETFDSAVGVESGFDISDAGCFLPILCPLVSSCSQLVSTQNSQVLRGGGVKLLPQPGRENKPPRSTLGQSIHLSLGPGPKPDSVSDEGEGARSWPQRHIPGNRTCLTIGGPRQKAALVRVACNPGKRALRQVSQALRIRLTATLKPWSSHRQQWLCKLAQAPAKLPVSGMLIRGEAMTCSCFQGKQGEANTHGESQNRSPHLILLAQTAPAADSAKGEDGKGSGLALYPAITPARLRCEMSGSLGTKIRAG